jgi:CheY-like chemotaxis protein
MMPGLDGVETTRLIRTQDGRRYADLPIIALTANAVHGVKEMFIDHGLNDFIAKPIDSARLEEVLLHWIPKEKQIEIQQESLDNSADSLTTAATEGQSPVRESVIRLAEPSPNPKTPLNESNTGHGALKNYFLGENPLTGLNDRSPLCSLDTQLGLSLSGGKEYNYERILNVFLKDAGKAKDILEKAITLNDLKEYTIHIHALKGAVATIGASKLSELATELEVAGKHGHFEEVKANTPIFLEATRLVVEKVADYLAKSAEAHKLKQELDHTALIKELGKLREAFERIDTKTIGQTLTNLKKSSLSNAMSSYLDKLTDFFFEVEYDQAVSLLTGLMGDLSNDLGQEADQANKTLN